MNGLKFLGLLTLLFAMSGCTDNALVRESTKLDPAGWAASEPVQLEFEIKEETMVGKPVDMLVELRHNGDYPYRNLFLFMEMTMPDNSVQTDTIECLLADRMGHWLGNGSGFVFSNSIDHNILFSYNEALPMAGKYKVRFEQAMRVEELVGVMDIGLAIQPSVK